MPGPLSLPLKALFILQKCTILHRTVSAATQFKNALNTQTLH